MEAQNNLNEVLQWSKETIALMAPARRRILIRKLLIILRRRNVDRMKKNVSPDNEQWEERKKFRKGQPKKMMKGLAKAKKMRLIAGADSGSVGFGDNLIARVHHYGLLDKVSPTGPTIKYPARPLIGISEEDENLIMQELVALFNV